MVITSGKQPIWLRQKAPDLSLLTEIKEMLVGLSLHTVCEEAHCPNQGECFSRRTATFLLMGDVCTRNCRFCAVKKGRPLPLDPDEPRHVARAVSALKLEHAVITSVTRDDLPDGGAGHFARTIEMVREYNPRVSIEVLIPDFQGSHEALEEVMNSAPHVINHNLETVPSLYPEVRPKAEYHRSLDLLRTVKITNQKIVTKSGLMLGLGEQHNDVIMVMEDLCAAGCDCLTMGQYLSPSHLHRQLVRYVTPAEFQEYQRIGMEMGFGSVVSGPLVRSSFKAGEAYRQVIGK
ncbi:lipoyl synthase [Chloroflexota bacterium]